MAWVGAMNPLHPAQADIPTWIVVAHRAGARLVEDQDDRLRVIETIDFPEGRLHESDRASQSSGEPSERGGAEPRDSARSHATSVFAGQLAERLQKGRNANAFRELVLIAAPRFLGALRLALDPTTASMVRGTLDKDFAGLNDRELLQRLEKL
jgi:protein required for attachment to host cells